METFLFERFRLVRLVNSGKNSTSTTSARGKMMSGKHGAGRVVLE